MTRIEPPTCGTFLSQIDVLILNESDSIVGFNTGPVEVVVLHGLYDEHVAFLRRFRQTAYDDVVALPGEDYKTVDLNVHLTELLC